MGAFRESMQREMALRGFAARTQRAYLGWMRRLVQAVGASPAEIPETKVREFLGRLAQKGLSPSTVNQAISGVRFFYQTVVPRKWDFDLAYQRAPQRLVSCQATKRGARYSSTECPCIENDSCVF